MKNDISENGLAPEQYELYAGPRYHFNINRREFFKILGSGIAITFVAGKSMAGSAEEALDAPGGQIGAWIHIGDQGLVTIYTGKVEVGQNIRTSLAQIAAEELEVPVNKIEMIMGDTALTPYDRGTFGSRSTPQMGSQLRKAAASAREVLIDFASKELKCERSALMAENGFIKNKNTGHSIPIGKLAGGRELIKPVDDKVVVKKAADWKIAGTSVAKVNGESFLTGKHKYVSDIKLPGMLMGKVLRAPAYGATLLSADISGAQRIPGVTVVKDGDFIGVAAPDTKTAARALAAIKTEWKTVPQPGRNEIFEYLKDKATEARDADISGNVKDAFDKADVKIEKVFKVDYIAHAPLEPRAGVAQWEDGKLTVWTGTQRPFGVQEELQEVFHLPQQNIRVIMPDTGSGYGGKHTGEAGIEAARLAKEAGKPVKVVWTREEEFTWAYFRPAGVIEIKAGATQDGMVTAWEFHNYNSGSSGIETSYNVPNTRIQFHPSDTPLRQGSYRGLAATANIFARESVMNDLAEALNIDPLAFRLQNLTSGRMKNVLNAAAEKFGWGKSKPEPGHGYGMGCGTEKGGYVATCAEVSVDPSTDSVKVLRAVVAFECGAVVNPRHLENQVQGAVVQGLGGALFEWVDFKEGKIKNSRFSAYRLPRFSDVPLIEVVILNRKDIPSAGAGEAPIFGIAPAIRNAIAQATGKKRYQLPLVPHGLEVS